MTMKPINVRTPSENFLHELKTFSEYQLDSCFGDGECMRVCPVVDKSLTIAELNECTLDDNPLTDKVRTFAYDCFQCGECTTVCPGGVQRDQLMINLKYKALKEGEPKRLKKYYKAKGISGWDPMKPESTSIGKELVIRGFNLFAGRKLGKLQKHVDKTEFRQADTLIYLGCYIFSQTGVQHKTVQMAEKLGIDYEVLGGLKSCCGWPQLMGGRIQEAEHLHRYVADVIEKINPKEIITGCMECFAALKRILQIKRKDWNVLTTTQWMLNNAEKLGLSKTEESITFHDSCHCTRKLGLSTPARDLIRKMYTLKEMEKSGEKALCCGYYNFKSNPELNHKLRLDKMEMVRKTGTKTMAVECITCQEAFENEGKEKGVVVTDLVDLVHKSAFDKK